MKLLILIVALAFISVANASLLDIILEPFETIFEAIVDFFVTCGEYISAFFLWLFSPLLAIL